MERNYYREGFESFLREKSDEYKLYPSEKVWNNIHQKMHPKRKWPYLAAALLLLGIGVGTKWMIDDLNPQPISSTENKAPQRDIYSELNKTADENETLGTMPRLVFSNPSAITEKKSIEKNMLYAVPAAEEISTNIVVESTISNPVVPLQQSSGIEMKEPTLYNQVNLNPFTSITASPSQSIESINQQSGASKFDQLLTEIGKVKKKTSWQLYFSPTMSYRKLTGQASKSSYSYSGFAYSANLGFPTDVNDAVTHKPSIGFELGTAFIYPITKSFRIKAGMQFNFNNYEIEAYSYIPEMAPYGANGPGNFAQPINTVSYYRNFNGFDKTWLKNSQFMISMPLGVELKVIGNKKVNFNIASTIQPTYVINNRSFLVSTNLKNYAQEPSLYRKWNVSTGAEAFLSINTGTVNWVLGPQFRYQILSSYKDKYPIKENLLDYGFKIGVNKTLK